MSKKTGVSYLSTICTPNNKKRFCVCYLKYGIKLNNIPYIEMLVNSDEFINKIIKPNNIEEWNNEFGIPEKFLVFNTVAYSYCNPEDRFDNNTGIHIAETRAQKHAFKIASKIYKECADIMLNAANRLDNMSENCNYSEANCKNHINELSK